MINSTSIWLIVGILLLLSEFIIPGFTIFFFGLGAILTSFIVRIAPPIADILWLQISIFSSSSILLLIFLRKHFNKALKGEIYKEREDYIGKECDVIESVTDKKSGRIKYQGTTWTAYTNKGRVNKNQKAVILGKKPGEPMVFIIEK